MIYQQTYDVFFRSRMLNVPEGIPSGNDSQFANLKPWPIEIVDLP